MNKPSAPLWVAHPDAPGIEINVAPVFLALQLFDSEGDSPLASRGTEVIRRTLRTLNLCEHNPALVPPGALVDLYQDLHRLEDMFSAINQQQPPPA